MNIQDLSSTALLKRRHQLARGLPPIEQILRGSLIETYKRCGRPNCHCADGPGHGPKRYLSTISRTGERPRVGYVPNAAHAEVREFLANFRKLREVLNEICAINAELLRRRENLDQMDPAVAALERESSAYAVVRRFQELGLRFPRRSYGGAWDGKLLWGRLTHSRVLGILANPSYAGTYVFGRHQACKQIGPTGEIRTQSHLSRVISGMARKFDHSRNRGPDVQ